ncbi:MAG: molybdopterin-dependent oxidoreductase [Candidatus Zixiibacteriota bacterium]
MNLIKLGLKMGLVVLVLVSIGACGNRAEQDTVEKAELKELHEYDEVELSSVNDFRENSIKGPQYIDKDSARLTITGLVDTARTYAYDDIVNRPSRKKVVTLNCVEGWSVTILWEGVLVRDLIKEAGIDSTAKVIIFHAYDGYSSSFPLNYVMENDIIMAHRMNDLTMPPERGFPFQLVAEGKWGYKWVKWITEIELSADENYRGYWENYWYSNDGDLNKGFFEEIWPPSESGEEDSTSPGEKDKEN